MRCCVHVAASRSARVSEETPWGRRVLAFAPILFGVPDQAGASNGNLDGNVDPLAHLGHHYAQEMAFKPDSQPRSAALDWEDLVQPVPVAATFPGSYVGAPRTSIRATPIPELGDVLPLRHSQLLLDRETHDPAGQAAGGADEGKFASCPARKGARRSQCEGAIDSLPSGSWLSMPGRRNGVSNNYG